MEVHVSTERSIHISLNLEVMYETEEATSLSFSLSRALCGLDLFILFHTWSNCARPRHPIYYLMIYSAKKWCELQLQPVRVGYQVSKRTLFLFCFSLLVDVGMRGKKILSKHLSDD